MRSASIQHIISDAFRKADKKVADDAAKISRSEGLGRAGDVKPALQLVVKSTAPPLCEFSGGDGAVHGPPLGGGAARLKPAQRD